MSSSNTLDAPSRRALTLRDLTDPQAGAHALQQLITAAHTALAEHWQCQRQLQRGSPILSSSTTPDIVRPLPAGLGLRPNMRALLPELLAAHALDTPDDLLLISPGQVYRRSPITSLSSSEPHQLELWRLHRSQLSTVDLAEMLRTVMSELLPGQAYRLLPAARPHLSHGMRIDLLSNNGWLPIGRTGLLAQSTLAAAGLDTTHYSVIGMSLGLDRVLMQRKGIPHIQWLRSKRPGLAEQMLDLEPFHPPAGRTTLLIRELSLGQTHDATELADQIRLALPEQLELIATADVLNGQKLRLGLHHPLRQLEQQEADSIVAAVASALQLPAALTRSAYA